MSAASSGVTVSAVIVEVLTRYPSREAFVAGDRRLTYAQSSEIVGRLMAAYAARGVGAGSSVAMLSPNRPESWLAAAAAYLLGASFTGLQVLGTTDDHVFMCDDVEALVLVVDEALADRAEAVRAGAATLRHVIVLRADGSSDEVADVAPLPLSAGPAGEEDVAWLQYTGGTTGRAKGVMLPQRALVAQVLSHLASFAIPQHPRYLAATPITHGAVLPLLPTLWRGGTVVTLRSFDPERWLATVEAERVNCAFAVPTMLHAILDQASPEDFDLSSLETVIYGASPISPTRLLEALERIGPVFQQLYGQMENIGTATTLRRDEHDPAHPDRLKSCGRAVLGATVAVIDDDGNELPAGEVGEIGVRGRATMLGYRNLPEETAAAMDGGWLRSGDIAHRDDEGFFYIVDRKKDMIISGGFNIYASEVEDVLAAHPGVASVAVIGIPDDKWGEAVHAVIVPRAGASIDHIEVAAFVKERKGPLHAPKSIEVVDALPVTTVLKVDKKALRAPYWSAQERQVH
jgi:fatty-acyl-CoA synthase